MKKILTMLLSIALLFTLCACNSTEFSSTTPYTFGDVTFQIPTSWGEPTENEDSTDTHFFYPEGQGENEIVPSMFMIDVTEGNFSDDMTEEEAKSNFKEFNSAMSDSLDIKSSKIVTSFKYPCEYVTGTNTVNDTVFQTSAYVFVYDGRLYNLMIGVQDDNKNDYSSKLTNIMNSLEFAGATEDDYAEATTEDYDYDYDYDETDNSTTEDYDYEEPTTETTEATTSVKKPEKKKSYKKEDWNPEITYDQLARTPDNYVGRKITFSGKVLQVSEDTYSGKVCLRVATSDDYDKVMLIEYESSILNSRVLEDDEIRFYGISIGLYTYESTMRISITIPAAVVEHIDIQ